MAKTSLTTTGFDELDQFLGIVVDREIKKTMRKGTRAGAKIVLRGAVRRVPERDGRLRETLVVRTARRSDGKKLPRGTIGHAVTHKNPEETFYSKFQQWGTKFIKNPSRYITDALYGHKREVVQTSVKVMRKDIKRLARLGRTKL